MSDAEHRDIAEALFELKQGRAEIKDAIKLEEARRAAIVKNLYRLRTCDCHSTKPARPNATMFSCAANSRTLKQFCDGP
jgi:hypothetical protein